jgi:hypothetical protein
MFATVDGLTFQGDGTAATYMLGENGIVGWFEGVGVRNARTARPTADGEFDAPGYLTGRLITVQGFVLTDSEAAFEAAIEALGDIPVHDLTEFTVTTGAGTKAAMVRRVEKPDINVRVWGEVAEFRLSLFAPDPTRYVP